MNNCVLFYYICSKVKLVGYPFETSLPCDSNEYTHCKCLGVKKFFIWPAMKNVLFWPPKNIKNVVYGLVKKVTEARVYHLDNIYIRIGKS